MSPRPSNLEAAFAMVARALAEHEQRLRGGPGPMYPALSEREAEAAVNDVDLRRARSLEDVVTAVLPLFREGQSAGGHARHFGFFHPPVAPAAAVADALVSGFDPQLALRREAPFAAAVERRLTGELAARLLRAPDGGGIFTAGGAEANLTATLLALFTRFPEARRRGVRALEAEPVVYTSTEAHGSVTRAVRCAGLGDDALRRLPADRAGRLKVDVLREAVREDRNAGRAPFLVVATVGTTAQGAVDPLSALGRITAAHGMWLHVDAAWGGLLAFTDARAALDGIEHASSLAFDPHKALEQPFDTGVCLVREPAGLREAFEVSAGYMPASGEEPYASSLPWSRRFRGARLWLTLLAEGWNGLEARIAGQLAMGALLRTALVREGFTLLGETPLPIACFTVDAEGEKARSRWLRLMAQRLYTEGRFYVALVRAGGVRALRVCVSSPFTGAEDIEDLVDALASARRATRDAALSSR